MKNSAFLSAEVSVFASAFAPAPACNATFNTIVENIRSGTNKAEVSALRALVKNGELSAYNARKRRLNAFLVSGTCSTRDASVPLEQKFLHHSGFLQIDLDRKDNQQSLADLDSARHTLSSDPHVACFFLSPSGTGIKVICPIVPDVHSHRACFSAAEKYFHSTLNLCPDRATKDPMRLCFTSFDPEIFVRDAAAVPFAPDPKADFRRDTLPETSGPGNTRTTDDIAADVDEILSFLPTRPDYDTWLRIASAVWNILPKNIADELLNRHMPEENPGEYQKKFAHRLSHIGIGSLVFLAKEYGYDASAAARRRLWCGRAYFGSQKKISPSGQLDPSIADRRVLDSIAADNRSAPTVSPAYVRQCFARKQTGDAELFAAVQTDRLCFDHKIRSWRRYDNGIWSRDDTSQAILAIDSVSELYAKLADEIQKEPVPKGSEKYVENKLRAITARIDKLHSVTYSDAVLARAQSMLSAVAQDFDSNPFLVACRNKTLDLQLDEARPHSPADRLSVALNVDFDIDAKCPHWLDFLSLVFNNDQDLIDFVARAVGYSLSGLTTEDVLFFCIGSGKNGKSTFKAAIEMLFGDYASNIKISALLTNTADNNVDYQKTTLKGRRIVFTDEVPEGRRFSEQQIKSMVGGDRILARAPYEKPFEFTPTHKLWPIGNHTPVITGTDNGIWRRILLVPFNVTIPPEKQRPRETILSELKNELPGILNWVLRGWLDYQDHGLRPPTVVKSTTEDYRASQDQIGIFLAEICSSDDFGACTLFSTLYSAYSSWCIESGEHPVAQTRRTFGKKLRERGFVIKKCNNNKSFVFGITLISEQQKQPSELNL